jgi:hypothetical protein
VLDVAQLCGREDVVVNRKYFYYQPGSILDQDRIIIPATVAHNIALWSKNGLFDRFLVFWVFGFYETGTPEKNRKNPKLFPVTS